MRKVVFAAVVFVLIAAITGCAGSMIQKEAMAKVKYAGVLSLTVKNPGPATQGNIAVTQQLADFALTQVEAKLKEAGIFKVVSAAALLKVPEFQNAGTVAKATGALAYLKENPDAMSPNNGEIKESTATDFMSALKEGIKAAADNAAIQSNPAGAAQNVIDGYKTELVGATGLPFIPYAVINNATSGTVTYVNGVKQGGENEGLKQMVLAEAKAVCAKTRLDAVIVVYGEAVAEPPKGVRVVTGDRVLGTIKYDMTMVIIDKNGEVIADFEFPNMDDLAPLKLGKPSYKAQTWRMSGGKNWPDQIAVDLQDTKGELLKDYKELAVISAKHLADKFKDGMKAE